MMKRWGGEGEGMEEGRERLLGGSFLGIVNVLMQLRKGGGGEQVEERRGEGGRDKHLNGECRLCGKEHEPYFDEPVMDCTLPAAGR